MIKVWRYWIVRPKGPLLAAQFALIMVALLHLIWNQPMTSFSGAFRQNLGLILLLLLPQLGLYVRRSDMVIVGDSYPNFLSQILFALGLGLILAVLTFWVVPDLFPGPKVALAAVGISSLLLLCLRPFLRWLFKHKRFVEGLLVLGSGEMADKFYRELARGKEAIATKGISSRQGTSPILTNPLLEASESGTAIRFDQLREITLQNGISRIVVAEPNVYNSQALAVALLDCKMRGLEVEQAVESYDKFNGKLWLEGIRPEWLVYSEGFKPPKYYLQLKRILDTACALVLMVVTAPLFGLVTLAIMLDSKGDVLFRQERVGRHGKDFVLFKFRTMQQDAEQSTGPIWAGEDDPRVTRVGRWLRKFRLDELPQLFNVLRGEMSLVGPRPERPHFVKSLNECVPYYGLRHCVMPGVTGWAQVLYPYGASVQDAYEKLQYDLYYARHMSLSLDLLILFQTIKVVLFGRGR